MADVFISYSQKDRELAKSLADFLTECGYDLWWDYELIGGTKFRIEIKKKLESSKAAIVIWTPNSVESDWVVEEAEEAKHTRKLIATRVADLDYRAIPLGFRGVHTELVTEPERILKALESIGVGPSRPPAAPRRGPVSIDRRLDPEAIAKAEQFAHWEFIKDSRDPAAFNGFIEQFPTSSFVTLARIQLGKLAAEAWATVRDSEDIDALARYSRDFPSDPHAAEAAGRLEMLLARAEEAASWARIRDASGIAEVEAHLARYPDGPNADAARARLAALKREREIAERWQAIAGSSEPADFENFLAAYPDSALAGEARARLAEVRRAREEADWQAVRDAPVPAPLLRFLKQHPDGAFARDALSRLEALPRTIEDEAWALVDNAGLPVLLRGFLAAFPRGAHANAAQAQLQHLIAAGAAAQPARAKAAAGPGETRKAAGPAQPVPGDSEAAKTWAKKVLETEYVADAVTLIETLGGRVVTETKAGGLFFSSVVWVVEVFGASHRFDSEYDMAQWTVKTIAPRVLGEQGVADRA